MRWLRRGRQRLPDASLCDECGRGFAPDEKAYPVTLERIKGVFWLHRECSRSAWGYDPETHESVADGFASRAKP